MSTKLTKRRFTNKPIEAFLKIAAETPVDPTDPNSLTYAEKLAFHAWRKALSNERDSFQWATLVLDRTEGKVVNELKVSDAGKIVEQIVARLMGQGLDTEQVINFLTTVGIDQKYIPSMDFDAEAELVN